MRTSLLSATMAALSLGGCGAFSPLGGSGGGGGAGGTYGYGQPTLEVTVNGLHFGPGAPDPGSGVSLVNTRSDTNRIQQSQLRVSATSSSAQAACSLDLQRTGDGVSPIGVGSYLLAAGGATTTADGQVDPSSGEYTSIPQGTWQCTGAECQGAGFVLTALDASHVEGYLSGTFDNYASGTAAQVTCSFYLPMLTYTP